MPPGRQADHAILLITGGAMPPRRAGCRSSRRRSVWPREPGGDCMHALPRTAVPVEDLRGAAHLADGTARLCPSIAGVAPYYQAGFVHGLKVLSRDPLEQRHKRILPLRIGAALEEPVA